mgnify:CR=1 FL=1
MVLQYYQNLKEMTSNTFYNVAFVVGFKCPRKIHLNTQCGGVIKTQKPAYVIHGCSPNIIKAVIIVSACIKNHNVSESIS